MRTFFFAAIAVLVLAGESRAAAPTGRVCAAYGRWWYQMPDQTWRVWTGTQWIPSGPMPVVVQHRPPAPHAAVPQAAARTSTMRTYHQGSYVNYWGEDGPDAYFSTGRGHYLGGG